MKSKVLLFSLIALAIAGCDDDINLVGPTIQPPGDDIVTYVDSFQVKAKTVYIDSIYAKTSQALLGEFEDPTYGSMKAEFMCQFYCKDDFSFRHEPIDGKIDSMQYILRYLHPTGWVGDSNAPQQMKIYKVTSPLTENFYVDKVNPRDYCDMSQMLGSKVFTAVDQTVPQHIRDSTVNNTYTYYPYIAVDFPKELGQQIYDATIKTPEHFKNQDAFNKFFPGLYVTTDPGTTGCILKLTESFMAVYYNYHDYVKASDGTDSLVVRSTNEVFMVTSEIIQLSHISNSGIDELLKPNDRLSYLKSPAGVYTQITFPIKEIAEQLGSDRVITNLPFSLSFLPPDPWEYALNPPGEVLLIPKDSLQAFFLEKRLTNNKTTFMSDNYIKKVSNGYYQDPTYVNTYMYNFNNISAFLENQLEVAPDKDIEMLIVPVTPVTRTVGSGYNQTTITTRIDNYFEPSGVKLKTDEASLKIGVRSAGVQKQ